MCYKIKNIQTPSNGAVIDVNYWANLVKEGHCSEEGRIQGRRTTDCKQKLTSFKSNGQSTSLLYTLQRKKKTF